MLLLLLLLLMNDLLLMSVGSLGSRCRSVLLLEGSCIGRLLLGAGGSHIQRQLVHQRWLLLLLSCSELRLRLRLLLLRLLIRRDKLLMMVHPSRVCAIRTIVAVLLLLFVLLDALVDSWQRDADVVILACSGCSGADHLTGCCCHLSVGYLANAPAIGRHDIDVPAVLRLSGSHCLLVLLLLLLGLGGLGGRHGCSLLFGQLGIDLLLGALAWLFLWLADVGMLLRSDIETA